LDSAAGPNSANSCVKVLLAVLLQTDTNSYSAIQKSANFSIKVVGAVSGDVSSSSDENAQESSQEVRESDITGQKSQAANEVSTMGQS
jgi:hypothetical protein